jgi:hypothetical protein
MAYQVDDGLGSETIGVGTSGPSKRVLRTAAEKRRIVEATLVPGASIAQLSLFFAVSTEGSTAPALFPPNETPAKDAPHSAERNHGSIPAWNANGDLLTIHSDP